MPYLTSQNIWRALVAILRADVSLKAALSGGIHEELAPEPTPYPFLTWLQVAAPNEDDWTSRMIIGAFDAVVYSSNPVQASNLDQSVATVLEGATLTVTGQTTLIVRRLGSLRSTDTDAEGKKIYGVGGSYEIWTDQPST